MKTHLLIGFSVLFALTACTKSNDTAPAAKPVVEQKDPSPDAKNLPLCSEEERTFIKLDVTPGYQYKRGEIKRLVEKSGPSMKKVYLGLAGNEVSYTEQEALMNAWRKTEGDTNCTRYQPKKTVNGQSAGAADCLVYSCTFSERETAETQEPADPNVRTTVTGAKYVRDLTYPKLGEAYRDPSGLIWGDVVLDDKGQWQHLNQDAAQAFCKKQNARLPTDHEASRLARDFGYDGTFQHPENYQPYQRGTKNTILPNWPTDRFVSFWATTDRFSDGKRLYSHYYSDSGAVTWSASGESDSTYIRCVVQGK